MLVFPQLLLLGNHRLVIPRGTSRFLLLGTDVGDAVLSRLSHLPIFVALQFFQEFHQFRLVAIAAFVVYNKEDVEDVERYLADFGALVGQRLEQDVGQLLLEQVTLVLEGQQ